MKWILKCYSTGAIGDWGKNQHKLIEGYHVIAICRHKPELKNINDFKPVSPIIKISIQLNIKETYKSDTLVHSAGIMKSASSRLLIIMI